MAGSLKFFPRIGQVEHRPMVLRPTEACQYRSHDGAQTLSQQNSLKNSNKPCFKADIKIA